MKMIKETDAEKPRMDEYVSGYTSIMNMLASKGI
jgi:hypothetical protein